MEAIHQLDIDDTGAKPITLDSSMVGGGLLQAADGVISATAKTPGFADLFTDVSSKFTVQDKSVASVKAYKFGKLVFVYIALNGVKNQIVTLGSGVVPADFYSVASDTSRYRKGNDIRDYIYDEKKTFYVGSAQSTRSAHSFFYLTA